MDKLKKLKHVIAANKTVIGQKALQLGGVALGAFIAGTVLAKTQPEADVVIVEGDVLVDSSTTIETPTTD